MPRLSACPLHLRRSLSAALVAALLGPLLCRCASKHQPVNFGPLYLERPAAMFSPDVVQQIAVLEMKTPLSSLERRRLMELYRLEARQVKAGSERALLVKSRISEFEPDSVVLEAPIREAKQSLGGRDPFRVPEDRTRAAFTDKRAKRAYGEGQRLWNRDDGRRALRTIDAALREQAAREAAGAPPSEDWQRVRFLRLRVALDEGDLILAAETYQEMIRAGNCSFETATAGFLMSLHWLVAGESKRALSAFESQCDPDASASNRLKRLYWKGRFREAVTGLDSTTYADLFTTRVAGYYYYLGKSRMKEPLVFPRGAFGPPAYLSGEIRMPGSVKDLVILAQERISARLYRDATELLRVAVGRLREVRTGESMSALLYVAHLFQASSATLDAMKVYGFVTSDLLSSDMAPAEAIRVDFLGEMFPRPHVEMVEPYSRQWGIDPDFVYSIMRQESAFNPGAVSSADARGLMQMMPALAREISAQWRYSDFSERQLFHASENLKLAIYHLHQLEARLPHPVLRAASYNAGASRVVNWWRKMGHAPVDVFIELIPITETRDYVKLVIRNYVHYSAMRHDGTASRALLAMVLPPPPAALP